MMIILVLHLTDIVGSLASLFFMSLSHRFSGNESSNPHKTDLKCHFNFFIPLLDKFLQFIPDGTNSYCIPFPFVFSL